MEDVTGDDGGALDLQGSDLELAAAIVAAQAFASGTEAVEPLRRVQEALQGRALQVLREAAGAHLPAVSDLREQAASAPDPLDAYPWLRDHTEEDWAAMRSLMQVENHEVWW
mmetsp:Transcript_30935/g.75864  ORF Transcript_30935/g.75864 Transcript_30935/m.75864 type:complete len:112 (+) Transcript_30935:3-338(+)